MLGTRHGRCDVPWKDCARPAPHVQVSGLGPVRVAGIKSSRVKSTLEIQIEHFARHLPVATAEASVLAKCANYDAWFGAGACWFDRVESRFTSSRLLPSVLAHNFVFGEVTCRALAATVAA